MIDEFFLDPHSFIVLEILNASNQKVIKQKILFQKISFLSLRIFKHLFELADFKAHILGPYSPSLSKTTEQLINLGDVQINEKKEFALTSKGKEILEDFHKTLKTKEEKDQNKEFRNVIENIKDYFNDFTTDEMLAFIYKSFPDYVEYSIRAEQLDYKKIFLDLYEKGKLGISKIAELIGCSYDEAYDLIKKNTKPIILL